MTKDGKSATVAGVYIPKGLGRVVQVVPPVKPLKS